MADQIEKMTRMRRNILSGILSGTLIAFFLNLFPAVYSIFDFRRPFIWRRLKYLLFDVALVIWFLAILLFSARYWWYKRKLKKDPSLLLSVYDERAKWNWLKACRFAFFIAVSLTIIWETHVFFSHQLLSGRFTLPNGPFLVLWGAVIALAGSFLYYNREAKNE